MSYQLTRAADDDRDLLSAFLTAIAARARGAGGPYYVELEGEPGQVLAQGHLLRCDGAQVIVRSDTEGNGTVPDDAPEVTVDVDDVTLALVP